MPEQRCHVCREPLLSSSEEDLARNAIEHFRLFHPDMHEIKTLVDVYLEHQFQELTPEDFA